MKTLLSITLLSFLLCFATVAYAEGVGTSESFRGPVGLVTYSLRDQISADGARAFDFIKEQGFKTVQIGLEGHFGMSRDELRNTLRRLDLTPIAAHTDLNRILNDTNSVVEQAQFFGVKYVGVAWVSHTTPFDEAQVLRVAEDFNRAGKLLSEHGIQFFYHNHGYEFYPYRDGLTLFDLLMEKTDPELVKFEMDVAWVLHPGQDPVELLKRYPNRWIFMHLKDLAKGVEVSLRGTTDNEHSVTLGTGQADFLAILKAAQEIGIKHYFIEDESPHVLKQIPESLKFLSTMEF